MLGFTVCSSAFIIFIISRKLILSSYNSFKFITEFIRKDSIILSLISAKLSSNASITSVEFAGKMNSFPLWSFFVNK